MVDLVTTIAIIFIAAGPFLLIANRFRLPTIPLLIVAGVGAGLFIDEGQALELAQYGIALLVFSFGITIRVDVVRTVLRDSEVAALVQILGAGSIALAAGLVIGIPLTESIYLGVAAALSSTIIGTALIQKEIRSNLVRGRLAQSIQLVQDLMAIFLLLVLSAEALAPDPIAVQLGYGLLLLLGAVLVNRYVFNLLERLAGGSSELLIIGAVSLLVVFIGAAEAAGLSIAVGAFSAGLAVRLDSEAVLDLYNGVRSIRDFFVAIFFVTVGALVALPAPQTVLIAAGLVVLTAIVKPAITTATLIYQGYEPRTAVLTSLNIDQISEFALIIAIEALILGYLTPVVFDAIILAAALTMMTSSLTYRYNEAIYRALSDRGWLPVRHGKVDAWSRVPEDLSDHVIIAGYGRQGRQLAETCEAIEYPYVVIENDPVLRDDARAFCDAYVFGDAMEAYTWQKARVESARLIISTIPFEPVSQRLLDRSFEADLILRADTVTSALQLLEEDKVLYVIVTDLLAGEQLVQYVQALLDGHLTRTDLRAERMADLENADDQDRTG
jgi:CPA2 family monovalent cation:H+ antiporter-2